MNFFTRYWSTSLDRYTRICGRRWREVYYVTTPQLGFLNCNLRPKIDLPSLSRVSPEIPLDKGHSFFVAPLSATHSRAAQAPSTRAMAVMCVFIVEMPMSAPTMLPRRACPSLRLVTTNSSVPSRVLRRIQILLYEYLVQLAWYLTMALRIGEFCSRTRRHCGGICHGIRFAFLD